MRSMVASLFTILALSSHAIGAPQLSVGFGEVDVSPIMGKKPVFLAGFGQDRKATKIHDPIMARAIVFSDGQKKVAMVCVDVVGLFLPTVEDVRRQLNGFDYVLVSSTHNHEAPDTLGLWGPNPFTSGVDPDYLKRVVDGAARAIMQASENLQPANAEVGTAKGPELLHDGRKPIVLHDDIVVLKFTDPQTKKALGLLVEWNVHPEALESKNTEVSSDHVGYTVETLKKRHGCPVTYFTGTVGGLMTSMRVEVKDEQGKVLPEGSFEKTERYGVLVANLADRALQSASPLQLLPLEVRSQSLLLPVDNQLYRVASQVGTLKRAMYAWDGKPTPAEYKLEKDITKPVGIKTELALMKLGELEVAVIPGEIYPELVLDKVQDPIDPGADFPDAPIEPAIYLQMKSKHKMIIGLGNDEIGYILPKRQWDEKKPYCYGLSKSQYGEINSLGPNTGPILCEVFKQVAVKK